MLFSVPAPAVPPASGMPGFIPPKEAAFRPFGSEVFDEARVRHVPVFLVIGDIPSACRDASVSMQLSERTVPCQLLPGMRPDVELLCQRAGALFSGEGALPLCALLLDDARPFLAAPLPPAGFPADPSRLYVWLSQADRRFAQNLPALTGQSAEVFRSFRVPPLRKLYSPQDAAHDLLRGLLALEDPKNGGFGDIKAPFVCALRFLHRAGKAQGAHAALTHALDAMLASSLYDPLDGGFFRSCLTDDWRVFVPEKPLALNALLALTLLETGRRSEAVRTLDFLLASCSLPGGGFTPVLTAPRESFSFSTEQVCAALGQEDGLRASRLLNLRRQHAGRPPKVTPSRFSPVEDEKKAEDAPALPPVRSARLTPEDEAFLHRVTPALLRVRAARTAARPAPILLCEDCALAAAVFAYCGRRLGEARYTQAAQRAVSHLISLPTGGTWPMGLVPSYAPVSPLHALPTCGANAALALALLLLGQNDPEYCAAGLRLLGASLHTFVREDGMPMHTPQDAADFFPRIPALFDGELPSPAALLTACLRLADRLRPEAGYADAVRTLWDAAAPTVHSQPLACLSLVDAMLTP